jgi:hypothetical protein
MVSVSERPDRQAALRALWLAMLERLTAAMADPAVNAATMNVCRDWLRDNGVVARTLQEQAAGLAKLATLAEQFNDLD